jgi:dihydroorotate dehydrogenase (NAD+) catalytic subunit
MIAGADAVQIGTANFVDPFLWQTVLGDLRDYLARHGIARLADLIGSIDTTQREKAWISS